jgi:hypothetical protein
MVARFQNWFLGNLHDAHPFAHMEHKGVEYLIVQTANPTGWKWTVHLDQTRIRTGISPTREGAIFQAIRTIDIAIATRPKIVK